MRTIVIAPFNMHQNLLAFYRQKDPFIDVKIITRESLISYYYGNVNHKAIPYLMKKYHYSYDNSLVLVRFIPYINEKIPHLFKIKEDLIKEHLISKNEYLETFFKDNKVIIHGYSNKDKELVDILNLFKCDYTFIKNERSFSFSKLYVYENIFDEVFYTLNKIGELIKDGTDINDIFIYYVNSEYDYYFKKFSEGFHFKVEVDESIPLGNASITKDFVNEYLSSKDLAHSKFAVENCEDKDLLNAFYKVVDDCFDPEMDFDTQLEYLLGELKHTRYFSNRYKNIVRVIDSPIYEKGKHIFVLGFSQGSYPEISKDNNLLSDREKTLLNINTSLIESEIKREQLLDFLRSDNVFVFSHANRSLTNRYLPSPLADEFDFKKTKEELPNALFSSDMADYYYAKLTDAKEFYLDITPDYVALSKIRDIPYGNYDNTFSGVSHFNKEEDITYSYTNINTFYQCPFQFYLGNVLGLDPFEGNIYTKIGKIAHKIFELHNNPLFDFDKTFDEEVLTSEFSDEELPIVNNLKGRIKEASEAIRLHQRYMKNPNFITEKRLKIEFDKHSYLVGVIDKTIILDDKYLAIVDYKTGNDSFNSNKIQYGVSLQLPTYCLLASNDKEMANYEMIGVFINNVIDNKLTTDVKEEDSINPYYRLNGKVIADIDKISYLDNTISGGKSQFIKSVIVNKTGGLRQSSSLASEEEFKEYISVALDKFKEANQRIRNNDFPINPLYQSKTDNACVYCPFKDICYIKPSQRRYINESQTEESEDEDNE